jgi:hypothetical protein
MGTFDMAETGLNSGRSIEEFKDYLRAVYEQKPYSMKSCRNAFTLNNNGLSTTITFENYMFDVDSPIMIEPIIKLIKHHQ